MIKEPIPFLANIALVARADGTLTVAELGQIEAIRKEYGLKKGECTAALKIVENGGYKLTPVGSFADQVKNLELMLRVALADSDLDAAETKLIADFKDAIGVEDGQLRRLREGVVASLERTGRLCPNCGTENPAESRFCGKCGTDLSSKSDVQVTYELPKSGIAIEFAESTAAGFPKALELAQASPGYQTCQKGKRTWYLAAYPNKPLLEVLPLVDALSGMRNCNLYLDGIEAQWDEIFGFAWCASKRAAAYRPREYCFGKEDNQLNPWGCIQARLEWTEWSRWFCYGKWEASGMINKRRRWRLDKDRIRHELESNLYRFRYCPHLVPGFSDAVLKHLPETVEPESDPNWEYHRSYEELPGSIKIVEKRDEDGLTFTNEYWADGVRPKGLQALSDILQAASDELGLDGKFFRSLLGQ